MLLLKGTSLNKGREEGGWDVKDKKEGYWNPLQHEVGRLAQIEKESREVHSSKVQVSVAHSLALIQCRGMKG